MSLMPWWLEEQVEVCVFCMQLYACGLECWCVQCGCAVCPLCARPTHALDGDGSPAFRCPDCAVAPIPSDSPVGQPQEAA